MRKLEYFAPQSLLKALAVFQGHGKGDRALALFFVIAEAAGAPGWTVCRPRRNASSTPCA